VTAVLRPETGLLAAIAEAAQSVRLVRHRRLRRTVTVSIGL
jgi:hypothetical protein